MITSLGVSQPRYGPLSSANGASSAVAFGSASGSVHSIVARLPSQATLVSWMVCPGAKKTAAPSKVLLTTASENLIGLPSCYVADVRPATPRRFTFPEKRTPDRRHILPPASRPPLRAGCDRLLPA